MQFALIVLVVLFLDIAGFWQVGNWSREFRGESPTFTYVGTIFPRWIFTILGCLAFLFAKQFSDETRGVVLFCVAVSLIGSSHTYLYYKAWKSNALGSAPSND